MLKALNEEKIKSKRRKKKLTLMTEVFFEIKLKLTE